MSASAGAAGTLRLPAPAALPARTSTVEVVRPSLAFQGRRRRVSSTNPTNSLAPRQTFFTRRAFRPCMPEKGLAWRRSCLPRSAWTAGEEVCSTSWTDNEEARRGGPPSDSTVVAVACRLPETKQDRGAQPLCVRRAQVLQLAGCSSSPSRSRCVPASRWRRSGSAPRALRANDP